MATRIDGMYLNITSTDDSYLNHPEYYIKFQVGSDKLVFSNSIPSSLSDTDLNSAQMLISGEAGIPKLYLWDNSAGLFRLIPLATNGAYRYVFCVRFTGTGGTMSEPKLEIWDDTNYNTNILVCLGIGTEDDSFIHAIETLIGGTPPDNWEGTKISGTQNLGLYGSIPLSEPVDLYFNLYIKIPYNINRQEKETPIFCIQYLYGD